MWLLEVYRQEASNIGEHLCSEQGCDAILVGAERGELHYYNCKEMYDCDGCDDINYCNKHVNSLQRHEHADGYIGMYCSHCRAKL